MGRERANLKGLTCSLTTPLFSQRPERTPGGHAPETRRGLRKDEVNGSAKRRRRHFERRARRGDPSRRRELPLLILGVARFYWWSEPMAGLPPVQSLAEISTPALATAPPEKGVDSDVRCNPVDSI